MAILIDENTKVLIQGITGSFGARHTKLSMEYGTNIVAGVTPSKGGQKFENKVPIFDTVSEAVKETGATASAIFVPPAFAADAILEAADAGIELIVCITEGIPVMDMMRVKAILAEQDVPMNRSRLVGPNCPGIVTPGTGEKSHGGCRIGIAPGYIHKRGNVGVVSRSGTLTYEAVWQLTQLGYGQSTCVGIGGDPINGTTHKDVLEMFNDDPETEAIIMIGEIGGNAEVEAARWAKEHCKKPICGFIAGATAPPGRRMGHAGAIVGGAEDTAQAKKKVLAECGIAVAETPSVMAQTLLDHWGK
ncbi:MAG: succinate--CoA ligase subunit alpha [Verrucomicrobiales bacterium]|nr:succinate--CoA ligase subunit alpha [Verrucomicrobiota bacterium JB025]